MRPHTTLAATAVAGVVLAVSVAPAIARPLEGHGPGHDPRTVVPAAAVDAVDVLDASVDDVPAGCGGGVTR